jgi:hypothetical protein
MQYFIPNNPIEHRINIGVSGVLLILDSLAVFGDASTGDAPAQLPAPINDDDLPF